MVRTLALSVSAVVAFGVVATPGLAGLVLLIAPLAVLAAGWWIALGAATHGRRSAAAARVRHHEFLGPGGPDDPFADDERGPR